ncbi:unnamed protein product [Trichobilharzia regenti]|nr:unnamed protein product [Trichobilharzia regenti]
MLLISFYIIIIPIYLFFCILQFIGSSLLFVHDESGYANVWLIDFAKIFSLCDSQIRLNHRSAWHFGNHEDGYLTGIDNLIRLFEEIIPIQVVRLDATLSIQFRK